MSGSVGQDRASLPPQWDAECRNRVLEMLVASAPLLDILETLLEGLELQRPGALCSLMLLDSQGAYFERVIAPSLPAFYCAALNGLAIGPGLGSCGTAAYTGERVVVEDIASHPYWVNYKALAAQAGLAACWSQPVLSATGRVLGTFAIYYREQRAPEASDLVLIQQSAALACIAIEKDAEASKLRDSEARYRTLVEWSPDPVLVHRMGTIVYANPAAIRTFGARDAGELLGTSTEALIHPDCRAQQASRMQALVQGVSIAPMTESRFLRLDGILVTSTTDGPPANVLEVLFEKYIGAYQPYIEDRRVFEAPRALSILDAAGLRCPPFTYESFERCMSYAVSTGWGKALDL